MRKQRKTGGMHMTDEELYQRYLDNDTAAADLLVQTTATH